MPRFSSYDGTELAYHLTGEGTMLVCLSGGPGLASGYLGDLGGLSAHRTLARLDNRGTGESQPSPDPAAYRCDRLVDDVEALRIHLGLERMDLLGHSAAGNLAVLYAARHPARLRRLVLVTPGLAATGVPLTEDEWHAALRERSGEPWYDSAYAAIMAWDAGQDTPENKHAARPFFYGRWDDDTAAHAPMLDEVSPEAAAGFRGERVFAPDHTRAALQDLRAPVLVYAGGRDADPTPRRAAELAALFPDGHLVIDPDAAHYPWVTGPKFFASTVSDFLR